MGSWKKGEARPVRTESKSKNIVDEYCKRKMEAKPA